MPDLPEIIETARLRLRPHRFDDVDDIMVYAVAEEWSRHMPIPFPYERKDAEEWIARLTIRNRERHASWSIELEGTVIGGVDLIQDPAHHNASLGYALSPAHWRKGFMTEAVGAVIEAAYENLPELNRIWAWADSRNAASLRVMEKLGMRREGCLRQHKIIREEFVDAVHCGLLRGDWMRGRTPSQP